LGVLLAAALCASAESLASPIFRWEYDAKIDTGEFRATAVTCQPAWCIAVGNGRTMSYSGGSWSAPETIDSTTEISSLSCASESLCVGVDDIGDAVIYAERYWHHPTSIDPQGDLISVSCGAPTLCVAVDYRGRVFVFNGTSWTDGPDAEQDGYRSVSCASADFCAIASAGGTVVNYENGAWTSPTQVATNLGSISCASSSFCLATSEYGEGVYEYDGTDWSSGSTGLDPDNEGYDTSVSCTSASFCEAIEGGQAASFNGASWSTPTTIGTHREASLSCTSQSYCVAIDRSGRYAYLAAGMWTTATSIAGQIQTVSCATVSFCVAADNVGRTMSFGPPWTAPQNIENIDQAGEMTSISCASISLCVAVGTPGIAVTFEGILWGVPEAVDQAGALTSVSCPTESLCMAVDEQGQALSRTDGVWNGGIDVDADVPLRQISCASATFCIAVDREGRAITYREGVWDVPQRIARRGLQSISCVSVSFCVAAEEGGDVLTYNGATWTEALDIDEAHEITAVSCVSPMFCLAVDSQGAALQFDGTAWSMRSVVPNGAGFSQVSCVSATFCMAVTREGYALEFASGTVPARLFSESSPAVEGVPVIGQSLADHHAVWSSEPSSFFYQWLRCDRWGSTCSPIADASLQTYVTSTADVGDTIRVQEFVANEAGETTSAVSPQTAVIRPSEVARALGESEAALAGTSKTTAQQATSSPHGSTSGLLRAALLRTALPSGGLPRIAAILRQGGLYISFLAPKAGRYTSTWAAAKLAHGDHQAPPLLRGAAVFSHKGSARVFLRLTPAGRRALQHARRIEIAVHASFTPTSGTVVSADRSIRLKP
jgi:hypothetical protein